MLTGRVKPRSSGVWCEGPIPAVNAREDLGEKEDLGGKGKNSADGDLGEQGEDLGEREGLVENGKNSGAPELGEKKG